MTERHQDPTLYAEVRADGTAAVTVDGVTQEIRAADEDSVRQQILERARQRAVIAGHPVRLTTSEPAGRWWLIVHANGQVFEDRSIRPSQSFDPAQGGAAGFPPDPAAQQPAPNPPGHNPFAHHPASNPPAANPFGSESYGQDPFQQHQAPQEYQAPEQGPATSADDADSTPWSAAIDASPDDEGPDHSQPADHSQAAERTRPADHRSLGMLGNLSPTDPSDYPAPNRSSAAPAQPVTQPSQPATQSSAVPLSSSSAVPQPASASQPSPTAPSAATGAGTQPTSWPGSGSSWTPTAPQDPGALRPSTPQHPPLDQSAGSPQSGPAYGQPWGEPQQPASPVPQPYSAQQALDAHRRQPGPAAPPPSSGRMPQPAAGGPGTAPHRALDETPPGQPGAEQDPGDGRHEPPPSDVLQVQPPGEEPFRKPTLDDLLKTRPKPKAGPAEWGVRGALRKATFGAVKFRPSQAEMQHRADVSAIQRSLSGPKTIAVVNPKGGACKTTTCYLIGATFGLFRGGYTLAWDNNETRGTLGWRSIPARHTNTAVDLLADLERFQAVDRARVGDLDNYVRTQGTAQFDVLASDEDAARSATLDGEAFDRLHQTLSRFYRLLIIDTGNNMRASNWIAAVEAADMLVISSSVREDTASSAAWLIDGLRSRGMEHKVEHAVTVLSAPAREPEEGLSRRLHDHFGRLTRAVLDVPHDPTLVEGGTIEIDNLHPETREAWVHVTAAIADGL
ncbi:MinD/ParA family ATP-binding protein [Microlunatus speluncae]|uniref:MinD/ParA family ATP-binding protein n=1 Tax=Microlunatus speluncae TaxID=2594267 RepID=UPI0012664AE2|nr:chromosome partitioning protein [Microlunatus speluncae]